jgi:hypothetical protein
MEEKFMQDKLTWVDELKLRISRGNTGYDKNVDPFTQNLSFAARLGKSSYDIYGNSTRPAVGFYRATLGNPNAGWQRDIVTNVGLDAIFWKGKLSLTTDFYRKESSGLLFPYKFPVVFAGDAAGAEVSPSVNIGNVLNQGFDLLVASKGSFSKNLGWEITATYDTYRNEIVRLNNVNYFTDQFDFFQGPLVRNEVGNAAGQFYGYKVIGIFNNDEEVARSPQQNGAAPGKFKYFDADANGVINESDRLFIGNPNPKFTLGVNMSLSWKSFDFSAFFYGSFGNEMLNIVNPHGIEMANGNPPRVNSKRAYYDSWTPEHTNTIIPIATINSLTDPSEFGVFNSFFVEKGTYFRNKLMMIGYTIPQRRLARSGITALRIYAQALNLFTITEYSGLDPEITGDHATGNENREQSWIYSTLPSANFGLDSGGYPNGQKQFVIGLNVSF